MTIPNTKPDHKQHKTIQKYYDDVYYEHTPDHISASPHLKRLAAKLALQKGQRILDVGCGTGNWLMAAHERGAIPSGIDLSEKAIACCKAHFPQGTFHAGPAESLPFDNGHFDLVSCLGCLEHFLDPDKALQEMTRVGKASARFLYLIPNADFLTRRLGLYGGTDQVDAHEEVRTLNEWQGLIEGAGQDITNRWKDLHVLSWGWIAQKGLLKAPLRAAQALALPFWPLKWQYQVYFLCQRK